jgi:hypothetical protein
MSEPEGARCPACGQDTPVDAAFCPYCGDELSAGGPAPSPAGDTHDPDPTVAVALPPVGEAIGQYAGDKFGGAMGRLRAVVPRQAKVDNRLPGWLALGAGVATVASTLLPWIQIEVDRRAGPGSAATGLGGRDGATVLVVGALAALIGLVLLLGRGDPWLKIGLFVTGGITTIVGIVDIADVQSKANALEERYGVPEGVVTASVGVGLWLVLAAGLALLAAGLLARRTVPVSSPGSPGSPAAAPGSPSAR